MSNPARLLLIILLTGHCYAQDPFEAALGAFDAVEASRDPELVSLTAARVTYVEKGLPARAMGLQAGDRLVGLDGLRVTGEGEWDLVRFRPGQLPADMRIQVLRDDRVIELHTQRVLPVRRLGFSFAMDLQSLNAALTRIGFTTPDRGIMGQLAPRSALSLLRWHAHRSPTADTTWIPAFATRFAALSAGRWAEAAALPTPMVPDDCPDLQRLARFHAAIAAYHATGEQPPDLQRHGESLAYYVIHYPYPRIQLPSLGELTHPDRNFLSALEDLRQRQADDHQKSAEMDKFRMQENESEYAFAVRLALLDQTNHGGWPLRHVAVSDRKSRPDLLKELRAHVDADDVLADGSRLALIAATLVDACDRRRKDPLAEVLPMMVDLRTRSPLLGYLATDVVRDVCQRWEVDDFRERLRTHLESGLMPDSEPPSLLLAHLRRHEASLEFHLAPDDEALLVNQYHLVYAALSRALPFVELHRQLVAPDLAQAPLARRQELLAQMLDYVRDSCQRADVVAMAKADLPGGLASALGEIAYWHARFERDQSWIYAQENVILRRMHEPAMIARLRAASIPWNDRDATTRLVEELYLTCGTPFATLLLAEDCAAKGRDDLANSLRTRVLDTYDRFHELAEQRRFNRRTRRWFLEAQLMTCAGIPATAELALSLGDRYQTLEKEGEDWDSIHLYRALAASTLDRHEQVVEFLCASFMATKQDTKPLFLTRDGTFSECRWFRTWLLERLVNGPGFTKALRDRVIAAARADLVDDTFAKLLDVPRESLGGDGKAPGANDF